MRRIRSGEACAPTQFHKKMAGVLVLATALSFLPAARAQQDDDASSLATVGGMAISVGEFEAELARRGGGRPGAFQTPEQRRALLDEMVEFRALLARAYEAGYDQDPQVRELFERIIVRRYQEELLDSRLDRIEVSDDEVRRYYEQHADAYARPARRQAAIVHIAANRYTPEEKRAELAERARAALAEAAELDPEVEHFGDVARRYSDDRASRYRGGVIGWLTEGTARDYRWDDAVLDAIYALEEPGDLGPVVETETGFYLVRLVAREESQARPFEALADGIRAQLLTERREQERARFMQAVRDGVPIAIDEARLASITPPDDSEPIAERRPPALPSR